MKVLIIFTLLVIGQISFASNDFYPGFIIRNNGDTVQGSLLKQNSRASAQRCFFKHPGSDTILEYSPDSIIGYRFFEGKFFISHSLKTPKGQTRVFLEFLIKGINSVYYYADESGDHYFMEKSGQELVELTEKQESYEGKNLVKPTKYKGKLRALMSDGSGIEKSIEKTTLSHKSLINTAKKYHEIVCSDSSCVIFERQNYEPITEIGVIAGTSFNQYKFGNYLKSNFRIGINAGLEMNIYRIFMADDNFFINAKLIFDKDFNYTFKAINKDAFSMPVTYNGNEYLMNKRDSYGTVSELDVEFNSLCIKVPLVINYKTNIGRMPFFYGAGLSDKIILSSNKNFQIKSFIDQYGKNYNGFLIGGIVNAGIEKELKNKHFLRGAAMYEFLFDPRAVNQMLRLRDNQFSFQMSFSF